LPNIDSTIYELSPKQTTDGLAALTVQLRVVL